MEILALCALDVKYADPEPGNLEKVLNSVCKLQFLDMFPPRENELVWWFEQNSKN